jgi:hypothetical protein
MKKLALLIVLVCTFVTLFSIAPSAVELPLRIVVNGSKLEFPDAQPFIDANGRTQTPARFIGEALGANVTWDGKEKKAVFSSTGNTLVLYIDKEDYDVNGVKKKMDTVALLLKDRTFVPARYVAEALGATVEWDASIRTVYISTKATPTPTSNPQGGTVKYYDGVAFNDVTDVDAYGRITVKKSKDFLLNFTDHLSFINEDGKYYIVCDYPEIPEGYEWNLLIYINFKDGSSDWYTPTTRLQECQIPREGSFKKEAVGISNINQIRSFSIGISLDHLKTDNTGLLDILFYPDETKKWCEFVPESGLYKNESYTNTFDFNKMFQWK